MNFSQGLKLKKSTPGTYVYEDADDGRNPIRSVYIAKSAFPKGEPPKKLKLIIEDTDENI